MSIIMLSLLSLMLTTMSTAEDPNGSKSEQSCSQTESKSCGECYAELGCFPSEAPWYSALRPFPAPLSPQKIDTKLYYYSRTSTQQFNITLWPSISLNGGDFTPHRPTTAFIVHGFDSDGNQTWLQDLKNAYLKRVDANVFLVDWGKGASLSNYFQVASNIRVVGAELIRFFKWMLSNQQLNVSTVHMMGHSLGAHICAYVGKAIHGISRITGFDPAQPGFELQPKEVRIDKTDADFVDILHTNAEPLVPLLGFGMIRPHGHVDFYMNGGLHQPGCRDPKDTFKELAHKIIHLTGIKDLINFSLNEISEWVSCAHGRSYIYYTDALNYTDCQLWGQKASVLRRLIDAGTVGWLEPLFTSLDRCTADTCLPIGLDTPKYKARGSFAVITARHQPYCNVTNTLETNKVLRSISGLIFKLKTDIKNTEKEEKKVMKTIKEKLHKLAKGPKEKSLKKKSIKENAVEVE